MKEFFCRLFTPWRAGAQFDAPEAFYGFLLARNKLLGIIRNPVSYTHLTLPTNSLV